MPIANKAASTAISLSLAFLSDQTGMTAIDLVAEENESFLNGA